MDLDTWRVSLAECFNFIVMRQGGLRRRPGTQFVGQPKTDGNNRPVRAIPFIWPGQSYILEIGHFYMRVWGDGLVVNEDETPYEVVTPWTSDEVFDVQFAQSGDVIYATHRAYPPRTISRYGEVDWRVQAVAIQDGPYLDINKTGTSLFPSGLGNVVPVMSDNTTPSGVASASSSFTLTDAFNAFDNGTGTDWTSNPGPCWLQYQFAAPTIVQGYSIRASDITTEQTIVQGTSVGTSGSDSTESTSSINVKTPGGQRAPRTWTMQGSTDGASWVTLHTQAGVTSWGDGERKYFTFVNDTAYTYYRLNIEGNNSAETEQTGTSISEWAMAGGGDDAAVITLSATSIIGINKDQGFQAGDVGRHIRVLSEDAYWHWFKIQSVTSNQVVEAVLHSPPLPSIAGLSTWRIGAFSGTTGYPRSVTFFQQRLVYGGTAEQPQSVWGSKTSSFDDFGTSVPLVADDAISLTMAQVGEITWLTEGADLLLGTVTAARALTAANKNEGFSATNIQQGKPAYVGTEPIQPVLAGDRPVFVSRFGLALRELAYSFDANGYAAPDISVLSEHMFRAGVRWISYAAIPSAILWVGLDDGTFVGATYERDQQMAAYHRHAIGGDGFVEYGCVRPGAEYDELWLLVRRTVPFTPIAVRTWERLSAEFEDQPAADAICLDCSQTYSGAAATSFGGLSHFARASVAALADGSTEGLAPISRTGTYTLPSALPASKVTIGFSYQSRAETLPIAQGFGDGSGFGRRKRIKKAIFNVLETGQMQVKAGSSSRYQDLILRPASAPMDSPPPLVTGDIETHIDDRWESRGVISILCDGPQPATIRSLTLGFDGEP